MSTVFAAMTRVSPALARQSSRRSGHLCVHQQLAPAAVAGRLRAFLTARHPVKTAAAVAAVTGLTESAVAKWLDGRSAPSSPALLVLVGTYGPCVLAAAMAQPPQWLDDAAARQRRAEIEAELDVLTRELREIT